MSSVIETKKRLDKPLELIQNFVGPKFHEIEPLFFSRKPIALPPHNTPKDQDILRKFAQILSVSNIELRHSEPKVSEVLDKVLSINKKEFKEIIEDTTLLNSNIKPMVAEGATGYEGHCWSSKALCQYARKLEKLCSGYSLSDDITHFAIEQIDAVSEAYHNIENIKNPALLIRQFKNNSLITLIAGYKDYLDDFPHVIGLSLFDDRLIYTDSGGDTTTETSGTYIYQIKKDSVNEEYFKKLFSTDPCTSRLNIRAIVTDEQPIFIPAKRQKIGNCAVSNPKKNMRGILACLMAKKLFGPLTKENIQKAIPVVNLMYKDFTKSFREDTLNEIISLCNQNIFTGAPKDTLIHGLIDILSHYINKQWKKYKLIDADTDIRIIKKLKQNREVLGNLWLQLPKCYQDEISEHPNFSDQIKDFRKFISPPEPERLPALA